MMAGVVGSASAQQMADTPSHSEFIAAVDEYRPAPGQFINIMPEATANDTPASMAAKCTQAIGGPINAANEDDNQNMISLGAWGGYVTFHFDHSIANISGQRDFYIAGNALETFSEPGIVMVMRDDNHNGLPDDSWYELAGSADEDSIGKSTYGYQVTYTRASMDDTPWADNQGNTGAVLRVGYHEDNEYFPLWLNPTLTFSGTLLPANGYRISKRPVTYGAHPLRYGYADNHLNTDEEGCSLDIDWAVDENRQKVDLDFIDFVRVYTGTLQHVSDMIGESSTELQGARDLHLAASLNAISEAAGIMGTHKDQGHITATYDLQGRRAMNNKGLRIVKLSNGQTKLINLK